MGQTRFVRRRLQTLSDELAGDGYWACPTTVARLLRPQRDSSRLNVKRFTGPDHPERDRQFINIQEWIEIFRKAGLPIISVDGKKKGLIGSFKGVYDLRSGQGHIAIGTSSDTSAFAVESIGAWWARYGSKRYRGGEELLILADGGDSNGHRPRLWKAGLQQRIADRYGLHVTVCHYPTGAPKWNPVEHRLFGPVSINWAGQPLWSLKIMLGWVRGTEVGGFGVTASLDQATYLTQIKVSDAEMRQLDLERDEVCPDWNDTISPRHLELLN